jgi:integrase
MSFPGVTTRVSELDRPPPGASPPRDPDLNVFFAGRRWLATYVATTRNPKGQRLAWTRFERYLGAWLGSTRLHELDGDHIREYRLMLEDYFRVSPHTVTHLLSDLRCFLRWAVSVGLIERSPFPPRIMPRIQETPPARLEDDEFAVLMGLGGRIGFALRFLLGTGLRWAEACRARREHVRGALLQVAHTKSGRMRRVPLSPALLDEIQAHEGLLVPYAVNSPGSFSRTVRRWTGIAGFHVHRCRHTFACRWLEGGGNLAVLQQILGHRDLSTTMRYAKVTDELLEREAERVARGLEGR